MENLMFQYTNFNFHLANIFLQLHYIIRYHYIFRLISVHDIQIDLLYANIFFFFFLIDSFGFKDQKH